MRPWESARVADAERETEPQVESLLAESEQERKAVLPVERREESNNGRSGGDGEQAGIKERFGNVNAG